jgi:hypothetical protein
MAEEIFGKLFTKEEADKEFGAVISRKEIETSVLTNLCEKSANVLLFNLSDDNAVILGRGRIPLYPDEKLAIPEDEVFHVFSVSIIKELLDTGGSKITTIERRKNHLTVTNGNTTMEFSSICPPYC